MFCKKCGNQINDDATVCSYCGSKVSAGADSSTPQKGGMGIGIAIGFFTSIVIGAILYFAMRKNNPQMAKGCLYGGIFSLVFVIVVSCIISMMII